MKKNIRKKRNNHVKLTMESIRYTPPLHMRATIVMHIFLSRRFLPACPDRVGARARVRERARGHMHTLLLFTNFILYLPCTHFTNSY